MSYEYYRNQIHGIRTILDHSKLQPSHQASLSLEMTDSLFHLVCDNYDKRNGDISEVEDLLTELAEDLTEAKRSVKCQLAK